ncbi:hypothetical protein CEUSTIGMA_g10965.t1 [Chlamydomonas eustigma]|uniref:Uncharacterized protein n=1 Tax=Chlamydomonas eustigma TaxID=1157962 RepID=A0A250XL85_9CHLO|nr:hypothetical protein CEUSTIGMA_g10965.t1 [Chlamydomonas eustigma]|eukprot:GAX83540.1 hypothetical protein CEUSTIGMA_g10965.t1 [Chlamydomonas eustigma]
MSVTATRRGPATERHFKIQYDKSSFFIVYFMAEVVGSQLSQGPEEVVVNVHTGASQPVGKEGLETAPLSQQHQEEALATQPSVMPPEVGSQAETVHVPVVGSQQAAGEAAGHDIVPPEELAASQVTASQAIATHAGVAGGAVDPSVKIPEEEEGPASQLANKGCN